MKKYILSLIALLFISATSLQAQTRTLKQVTIESSAEADRVFSMLMGDEVPPRREFIETHAKYAKIDV